VERINEMDNHRPEHRPEKPEILSTQKARQGVTGHNVRYVLIFSMIAAVIGLAVTVWMIGRPPV
jgi:heme/copper-type cytochrome/quinol oxidase subunit 1